jgi:LacI family transcriptional regulator
MRTTDEEKGGETETMKKKKVTVRGVAEKAGVSPTTVSMILNGHNEMKFPTQTCRRVLYACEELGYVRKGPMKASQADNRVLFFTLCHK